MANNAAYWDGWLVNQGEYFKDCFWAYKLGVSYLQKYKNKPTDKQKCVVFDIDDTLVFGDPDETVGVREMELGNLNGQSIFALPRNEPICKLAEAAKKLGYVIVVLTARPSASREASRINMIKFNIPFDALIMNDGDHDPCFKIHTRRKIANKYDIALTIGDQATDVLCPGGDCAAIKLPDPNLLASYAWIPPGI